ncbi:hypothetical protein H8876_08330 [Clostridiales Family XIII bacterium BX16]|uniref:Uncharacterized protein n=1 Tax=Lentihominibacter faecis TaxID=2764712 RepID=A0A923NH48_9FIRM|nr:hypothetical protein [Lentihominibacter faecis]MBC6000005.1 hypothetical protein [Lentihominibacter faecis]
MIYAIALCLYVLCYLVIQVMFLFYGCHVSQHKRKVFVILVVYTIIFKGMDFLLNSPDPSALSTTTYWTYWAVHTLDTFIIIALMAVYADGTLGRNWVKLFFYYDLVTTGANMLIQNKLVLFLTDHHLVESASLFSASHPKDLLWILAWTYTAAAIALSIVLFRKPLNRLISKIPENLCLLLMGITFLIYIGRVFVMFIYRGQFFLFDNRYSRDTLFNADVILVILLLITLYLLITVARQKYQLQRIQRLESNMQLRYYQNVSMLHGSIRSLRHDLSNHLAIPEGGYRDSLLTICDRIDSQIHSQLSWQSIKNEALSSREKYEIFRYLQNILQKKKLPPEVLCIDETEDALHFTIRSPKRLSLLILKHQAMFKLTNQIAKTHGGSASWTKDTNRYIFTLSQLS